VFATTHSNHYLDLGADYSECATLRFRRKLPQEEGGKRFEIRTVGHDDRMLLQELGVRASSVFLTNAAIWVEGITDRLYLREFLARYLRELLARSPDEQPARQLVFPGPGRRQREQATDGEAPHRAG
jgi:predicted ATP-dependent endonuclease of OLD family